jgi:hypothetical protein
MAGSALSIAIEKSFASRDIASDMVNSCGGSLERVVNSLLEKKAPI